MAKTLVRQMTSKWDPHKYKDDYKSALLKLISKKVESGGHALGTVKKAPKRPANIVDLTEVLRRSLRESTARKANKHHPARTRRKAA